MQVTARTTQPDVSRNSPSSLQFLGLAPGYRTGANDLIQDFYVPCLSVSRYYDRAVGIFGVPCMSLLE